ncbi:hypothetical protein FBR02_06810 [Anaerolineae bacterium CFX9]|nr:hypothetical protein [Anaerolineae bacterium CFX9]
MSSAGLITRITILLVALFGLLIGYYWVHKPYSLILYVHLAGILLDALAVSLLWLAGSGIGRFVSLRLLKASYTQLTPAERLALASMLGLSLVSIGALALGMVGLFNRWALWGSLLLAALLCRQDLRAWLGDLRQSLRSIRAQSRADRLFAILIAVLLIFAFLHAAAPVVAWDSLTYHLVGPSRWLEQGRITPEPDNFYLGFPKALEMLFSIVMSAFGRDTAPAMVHFVYGSFLLLLTGSVTFRLTRHPSAAWLSVTLLLTGFNVWQLLGWAYVDLAIAAYALLIVVSLHHWVENRDRRWLIAIGLMVGFATSMKYPAAALGLGAALCVLAAAPRQVIRHGLICAAAALIAFSPWMVRGALHWQNPIFPYVFDGLNWDHDRARTFNQSGRGLAARGEAWQVFLLPVTATVFGQDYGDSFSFTVNPFLLTGVCLIPLVWGMLRRREKRFALLGVTFLLPLYVFWAATALTTGIGMQTRLNIGILPVSAVLSAIALTGIFRMPVKPLNVGFVVRVLIVISALMATLDVLVRVNDYRLLPYFTGQSDEADYRFWRIVTYPQVMAQLGQQVPAGSTVRFLYEPRGYDCPPGLTCRADVLFDHWGRGLLHLQSVQAVFESWRAEGDDFILFFEPGYQAFLSIAYYPEQEPLLLAALEDELAWVWTSEDGRYTLYTWRD